MTLLAQVSFGHLGIASGLVLACALSYYAILFTRHELRIRKIGGVRAPSLTRNPLIGKLSLEDGEVSYLRP